MKLISPDTTKCVKCCTCVKVCPMGVIEIASDGFPAPKTSAFRLCINCGYCVDVCALGALNHKVRRRSSETAAAIRRGKILQKKKKSKLKET